MNVMATPPSQDSLALFKLLVDRQWHRREDIVSALAATVPPGRALRRYEEEIEYRRRKQGDPNYDARHTDDARISYGARIIAQAVVNSWHGRGLISRGVKPNKELRVKPGFEAWGILGFQPGENSQDPGFEPGGSPEVPPGDSVASEDCSVGSNEPVEPDPQPEVVEEAAEPQPAPEIAETGSMDPQDPSAYSWPSQTVLIPVESASCLRCGQLISNQDLHDSWHENLAAQAPQIQAESDRKILVTLLGDTLERYLDEFQQGMQDWLTGQFEGLEQAILSSRSVSRRWLRTPGEASGALSRAEKESG